MKTFKILVITIALLMPPASMADCCCRKIVGYTVATSHSEIEKLFREGWQPFGGVATNRYGIIFQAMAKYEE